MSRIARLLMPLLLAVVANALVAGAAAAADRSVESLARSLTSDDAQARVGAAREISRLDVEKISTATAELVKALSDSDPLVRAYAALALGKLETVDAETVAALSPSRFNKTL